MNNRAGKADWCVNSALNWARQQLQHSAALAASDSHALDAELLLSHCLHKPRTYLYSWPDTPLSAPQQQQFTTLVQRRVLGEPIAYLLGHREFWDLDLHVSTATLIPRPETETLVEAALALIPEASRWNIADLGTGSGAIALALARHRPACHLLAVDKSASALNVASGNAQQHAIANVDFVRSDWFSGLARRHFDLLVCNPPYVAARDPHLDQGDVRFEPQDALVSGPDGLDDLRHIIATAAEYLRAGGYLMLEHGFDQAGAVAALFAQHGWRSITTLQDLGGQDRVTYAQHPLDESNL